MSRYRHEYKYIINEQQKNILMIKASGLMQKDPYANEWGSYLIRSLYFDDWNNSCYYENEDGTDPRSKFRIRYYNCDTSKIKLEKKIKNHGMTLKVSCTISKEQCETFMNGSIPEAENEMQKTLFEEMKERKMQPKVIVSYERIPYIYGIGNVRITFDTNITASNEVTRFLQHDFLQRPILSLGKSVLEVKWDEVFPAHVKEYMSLDNLQWSTFSKYYLCRKYNINGGIR